MAVRGEEVASSIETLVREAIEKMVGEIRATIEDVRVAVDQQLKAALQSVQADVNSVSFSPQIKKAIAELEESLAAIAPAAPVTTMAADAARLKRAIKMVEQGKSQVDILNALLEQCLEFGSRAALLILRGETFSGWKGVGFAAHGGNDESIKRFNATPGLIAELDRVLRDEQVVIWDGANLSTRFGVSASARAILVPMVIKDKVSAAVYVDAVVEEVAKIDPATIELLVFTTGLLIDTLAIRKKMPSPSLTEPGEIAAVTSVPAPAAAPVAVAPAPPPAAAAPRPAAAPAARPVPPPAAPAPPLPRPAPAGDATVAISAAQIRERMAAPAAAPSSVPAPAPAAAAPATPSATEERPTTQYVPPTGVSAGRGVASPPSEQAKKHDEARRFARLLVSEIKLYNEAKVEQGRKNRDLYERLKEDIDRSRQMYDERISDDVRKTSNYFYDELVRILADGSSEALGL